jgi:large subunit ribosomal protein L14|tara:strand:+ start:1090 stop:1476 length:387 start_codon:yes stop_codon:yes gene_type:complete
MIQTQSKLKVTDNSGGKIAQCIKVLGGYQKRYARTGDQIVVAVKKAKIPVGRNLKVKVKKGSVNKAILIRTRKPLQRKDGSSISFAENATLLLNAQEQPVGTRIIGPIPYELKRYKGIRLASLASGII